MSERSLNFFSNVKVNREIWHMQRLVDLNYGLRPYLGSQIKLWS